MVSDLHAVLVPVLHAGDRLRHKQHRCLYATFGHYDMHRAGWAVLLRDDGILDIGPLANWEVLEKDEREPALSYLGLGLADPAP